MKLYRSLRYFSIAITLIVACTSAVVPMLLAAVEAIQPTTAQRLKEIVATGHATKRGHTASTPRTARGSRNYAGQFVAMLKSRGMVAPVAV